MAHIRYLSARVRYMIINGPGTQRLALSLTGNVAGPPGIDMVLASSCQFTLGCQSGESEKLVDLGKTRVAITGMEHEGSPQVFNIKGHSVVSGDNTAVAPSEKSYFRGYYDTRRSAGWIEFLSAGS